MNQLFKRAKSDEKKAIRMKYIMDITDQLFHEKTYHEITLSMISKEANFARGGLYKYATSKEDIFLLIFLQKQEAMLQEILISLQSTEISSASLAHAISQAVFHHQDFLKYFQILTAIIETNVTIERLADFKKQSFAQRGPLLHIICDLCKADEARAMDAYLSIMYHSVYLYDRTSCSSTYRQAMELAGLEITTLDFAAELEKFVYGYLKGLAVPLECMQK